MSYTLNEWQQTYKDPRNLIVQASAINGSDSWQPFPIGMQYSYINNFNKKEQIQIGSHSELVLCSFTPDTDKYRRRSDINRSIIQSNLKVNGIINSWSNPDLYFDSLPNYKFVISPEGNGIDCHRHYESLLAGCIPIIEYNSLIEEKYKGCPILYTKDYSEITTEYLKQTYIEMINKQYDFSRLFLNYYDLQKQNHIKIQGNYWTSRFTGKTFY
jgi:hypothetical protein